MKTISDKCSCCDEEKLILVNGALVCRACDNTESWPSYRRAGA